MRKTKEGGKILTPEEVQRGAQVLYCDADETTQWFRAGIKVNTVYRSLNRLYKNKRLRAEEYEAYRQWSAEFKGIMKQINKHVVAGDNLLEKFTTGRKPRKAKENATQGVPHALPSEAGGD